MVGLTLFKLFFFLWPVNDKDTCYINVLFKEAVLPGNCLIFTRLWEILCAIGWIIVFLLPSQNFWQISAILLSLRSRILPFSVLVSFFNCQERVYIFKIWTLRITVLKNIWFELKIREVLIESPKKHFLKARISRKAKQLFPLNFFLFLLNLIKMTSNFK